MDEETDAVRGRAAVLTGDARAVEPFTVGREVLHRENLGTVTAATVLGPFTADDRAALARAGIEIAPVSLQQLIVRTTQHASADALDEGALR